MIIYHARAAGTVNGETVYAAVEVLAARPPRSGRSRTLRVLERDAQIAAGQLWREKYPAGSLTSTTGMYIRL